MRGGLIYIIFFLIFILSILGINEVNSLEIANKSAITGKSVAEDAVTGDAIQSIGITIDVITNENLTLAIKNPKNETYFYNISLPLELEVSGAQNIWYNLDNGANTTFTSSELSSKITFFNVSGGMHTIHVFANSSTGSKVNKNTTFTINQSYFNFSYGHYEGEHKGNSTYFKNLSYSELQNISNFILEHSDFGKIFFNELVNLTDDATPSDNFIDLNKYTNISSNFIEINSSSLRGLNRSARLSLYNITFIDPKIIVDGIACPASICTKESYSNGVLTFNVTHFTSYYAEESQAGSAVVGSSNNENIKNFNINKEKIKISLKQGEIKKEQITIENTKDEEIKVGLTLSKLGNFIKLSENSFNLKAGEVKAIELEFNIEENTIPNLYIGKLIIQSGEIKKEVLITIEVRSKNPLFDVSIEIPQEFIEIYPGQELTSIINIYNLGDIKKTNAVVDYIIKDENNEIILQEQEEIEVETQISYTKTLKLPENIESGNYILYVKINYNNEVASATAWFEVKEKINSSKVTRNYKSLILILLILIIVTIIILLKFLSKNKKIKIRK